VEIKWDILFVPEWWVVFENMSVSPKIPLVIRSSHFLQNIRTPPKAGNHEPKIEMTN
jgi:hypothetical protein